MEAEAFEQAPRSDRIEWRQAMQAPKDVEAMLKLASLGWGAKRIAKELGCSRNTVRRYLRQDGWQPCESPQRFGRLDSKQIRARATSRWIGNGDRECSGRPPHQTKTDV